MHPLDLSESYKLAAAIFVGAAFGFLLIRSDLARPRGILDALRLRNGRLLKTLLLTLAGGSVLFFAARRLGLVEIQVKPGYFWGSLLGGICCGCGLVACAMTPVTAVANFAAGRFYALWTVLGMLLALPAVDAVSGWLSRSVYRWGAQLDAPPEPAEFFRPDNPALWAAGICTALLLLVHFTVGDPEE